MLHTCRAKQVVILTIYYIVSDFLSNKTDSGDELWTIEISDCLSNEKKFHNSHADCYCLRLSIILHEHMLIHMFILQ